MVKVWEREGGPDVDKVPGRAPPSQLAFASWHQLRLFCPFKSPFLLQPKHCRAPQFIRWSRLYVKKAVSWLPAPKAAWLLWLLWLFSIEGL